MFYLCYLQKLIFDKTWYSLKIWHTPFSHTAFPIISACCFFMYFLCGFFFFLIFLAFHLFVNTSSFLLEHRSVVHCLKTSSVQCLSYHCSWKRVPLLHVSYQQKDLACCNKIKSFQNEKEKKIFLSETLAISWCKLGVDCEIFTRDFSSPSCRMTLLPLAQETRVRHCTQ